MSSSTAAVGKYATYLKKVYLRSKLPVKGKLPSAPCQKVIKLATIEIKEKHSHLALCKLNRSESVDEYMQNNRMVSISMSYLLKKKDGILPKLVVVQGVPGIGKSTFAWKFCRKWAKGKIYQQYHLVVLLRMRDQRVRDATKLSDLFFSESRKQSKEVTEEIIATNGQNILIVMEGIDELPVSCLADGTPLSNLLQGESLPEVTILATSRPWAVQTLEEKCGNQISRQVEILGFTREDILKYVSHAFTEEEQTEFLQYLQSHPQLESIMHIPLNAAFVVQIYKQFHRSQQAIPNTLTQLYTALVEGLLLRYMKSNPDYKHFSTLHLESLPEPLKTHFQQLCLLAFMSFTKLTVQVTFTDSEAALYDCFDFLGLMQSSTEPTLNTGTTVTHSFLHFTIQEFLAAYHLSNQPLEVQKTFLEVHSNDPQFRVLITFLVGLNSNVLHCLTLPKSNKLLPFHIHLLYESQSPQDVCKFLGKESVKYYPTLMSTSFDLHALSYCLCHSDCFWRMHISLKNLSSLFSDCCVSYRGCITHLCLDDISENNCQLFFTLPARIFEKTCYLRLVTLDEPGEDCAVQKVLSDGRFTNLKMFTIFNGYGQICHTKSLLECLCRFHSKLVHIVIFNSLHSDLSALCKYIQSRSSELTLSLYESIFTNNSLHLLISTIAFSKAVTHLDLARCALSVEEFEMLSVALSANTSLKSLGLANCSINGEGAELLSNELGENHTLLGLDLRNNCIDTNGATALASMLAVNTSLKILYLSHNEEMGQAGALQLISALEQDNKTFQQLTLPAECEPIEYGTFWMDDIRNSHRIEFISTATSITDTIACRFSAFNKWPHN